MIKRTLTTLAAVAALALPHAAPVARQAPPLVPIDPQRVQDQDTMTWDDYRPIPDATWGDNSEPGARVLRAGTAAFSLRLLTLL